jgi:hypothetical protein
MYIIPTVPEPSREHLAQAISEARSRALDQLTSFGLERPILLMRTPGGTRLLTLHHQGNERQAASLARLIRVVCVARAATCIVMAFQGTAELVPADGVASSGIVTPKVCLLLFGEVIGGEYLRRAMPILALGKGEAPEVGEMVSCRPCAASRVFTGLLRHASPSDKDRFVAVSALERLGGAHLLANPGLDAERS